jgi:hypothetical protein
MAAAWFFALVFRHFCFFILKGGVLNPYAFTYKKRDFARL